MAGRARAAVREEFAAKITLGMQPFYNVFCGFQDKLLATAPQNDHEEGRRTADLIGCGIVSSASIGLDYALDHSGIMRGK